MKLKRIFAAVASAAMLLGLSGCSSSGSGTSVSSIKTVPDSPGVLRGMDNLKTVKDAIRASEANKVYKIGIAKLMDHPALNLSEAGFVAALEDAGFVVDTNLILEYRNGDNDSAALDAIADEFVSGNEDLIFAIATPAAQACANKTTSIPVIATAVTDFVDAGLVGSNARPGSNVSGTTDMSPVEEQIDLMRDIFPDVRTVGFVYTASESNSVVQINSARKYAESKGLSAVEMTINTEADIERVFSEIAAQCDAVYLPTDNLIAANMSAVAAVCNPAQVPVFCAESNMVESGGFGTLSIDYYDLGYQAGLMAMRVLIEGAAIDRMSIQKSTKFEYCFNGATIEALGVTLPAEYRDYIV